jgi:hypothetical protein
MEKLTEKMSMASLTTAEMSNGINAPTRQILEENTRGSTEQITSCVLKGKEFLEGSGASRICESFD